MRRRGKPAYVAPPTGGRLTHDSEVDGFTARAQPGDVDYPERVAQPIMQAVDALPPAYRRCVHEFGYVDVYRAWRAGWSPERIAARAAERGGVFEL